MWLSVTCAGNVCVYKSVNLCTAIGSVAHRLICSDPDYNGNLFVNKITAGVDLWTPSTPPPPHSVYFRGNHKASIWSLPDLYSVNCKLCVINKCLEKTTPKCCACWREIQTRERNFCLAERIVSPGLPF